MELFVEPEHQRNPHVKWLLLQFGSLISIQEATHLASVVTNVEGKSFRRLFLTHCTFVGLFLFSWQEEVSVVHVIVVSVGGDWVAIYLELNLL